MNNEKKEGEIPEEVKKWIKQYFRNVVHDKNWNFWTAKLYEQFIEPLQKELNELREEREKIKPNIVTRYSEDGKSVLEIWGTRPIKPETEQQPEGKVYDLIEELKRDPYPEDIFLPVSSDDLKKIHELLMRELNMPIDRLSGHIGRLLRKPLREMAELIQRPSIEEIQEGNKTMEKK
jgi:hypothetical protein